MQLEYLPDGSPDCPLIRLFDFTAAEAGLLAALAADLAAGRVESVIVHELSFVAPVGGCGLVFRLRSWDQGVIRVGPLAFDCGFTAGTWDNVVGLVESLTDGRSGHQWLAGAPGETALLMSGSGQW